MHTVFPHPTLSEMMHESVLDAYGRRFIIDAQAPRETSGQAYEVRRVGRRRLVPLL